MDICLACEAPMERNQFSDYWRCDNGHTIYRGNESKAERFELRKIPTKGPIPGEGRWAVWDKQEDEPFYDEVADEYAYYITESRARSILSRLI